MKTPVRIGCILEWENAEGLERDEARAFLDATAARLTQYAQAQSAEVSLMLVHDEDVTQAQIDADIDACPACAHLPVSVLYTPDTPYYEKKAVGGLRADADILLFADSDCTYGPDWIAQLLDPILEGRSDITAGSTRALSSTHLIEQASTFAWFFPSEDPLDPLHGSASRRFFANNFAMRADLMARVPVPRFDASRSHGGAWLQRLGAAGATVLRVPDAIARHKQYDTVSGLLRRAAVLGRDKDFGIAQAGGSRLKRLVRATGAGVEMTLKYVRRMSGAGWRVLGPWRFFLVLPVGIAFQLVIWVSQLMCAATGRYAPEKDSYDDLIAASQLRVIPQAR